MKNTKKVFSLDLIVESNGKSEEYYKIDNKENLMKFIKGFKNKKLRKSLSDLLDNSNIVRINYLDAYNEVLYKMSKVEYLKIEKVDPNRENERGEKIEKKRLIQSGGSEDIISNILKTTLTSLLFSKKLENDILDMGFENKATYEKEIMDNSGNVVATLKITATNSDIKDIEFLYGNYIRFSASCKKPFTCFNKKIYPSFTRLSNGKIFKAIEEIESICENLIDEYEDID